MKAFLSASGECLSGALWWEDLVRLAEEVGFCKPRLVTASLISVGNEELEKLLGKGLIVVNLCFQSKLLWLPFQCNYQLLFRTTFLEVHFFYNTINVFVLNLGDYKFVSATYRLFKLPKNSKKERCLVMYDGNITGLEKEFEFDAQYSFKV